MVTDRRGRADNGWGRLVAESFAEIRAAKAVTRWRASCRESKLPSRSRPAAATNARLTVPALERLRAHGIDPHGIGIDRRRAPQDPTTLAYTGESWRAFSY